MPASIKSISLYIEYNPGSVYIVSPNDDARLMHRLCAPDGTCIAWSHSHGQLCEMAHTMVRRQIAEHMGIMSRNYDLHQLFHDCIRFQDRLGELDGRKS